MPNNHPWFTWGDGLINSGYVMVPNKVLQYQQDLGLTSQEMNVILQVASLSHLARVLGNTTNNISIGNAHDWRRCPMLSDVQKDIFHHLKYGKANAITGRRIAQHIFGVKDDRFMFDEPMQKLTFRYVSLQQL